VPFVKVKTSLRHNLRKNSVSRSAALAYYDGLTLAEDLAADGARTGAFEHISLGPLSPSHLAVEMRVSTREMEAITNELLAVGLWERDGDTIVVARFEESTTPSDPRAADRMRAYRERNANKRVTNPAVTRNVTPPVTPSVTDVTRNVTAELPVTDTSRYRQSKRDKSKRPLTGSTVPNGTGSDDVVAVLERPQMPTGLPSALPDDVGALKRVALPFLAAFGNYTTVESQRKHGPTYMTALASFRSRGATTAQTWAAFSDAWLAREGKPLFGELAKTALAFLPNQIGGRRDGRANAVPQNVEPEGEPA
jgi:hypothetical protein